MSILDRFFFFYENAGFSYDPKTETEQAGRMRCARQLAEAEEWALQQGYSYNWNYCDTTSADFTDDKPAWELWRCEVYDEESELVQSLSAIDFGRDGSPYGQAYAKVVEAELALEQQISLNMISRDIKN